MSEFVHLHCHTEYSLLDGAIRLKDLCAKACEYGMPAAAITDHGNMFGAVNFYLAAKKAGIKPILGCEVYVAGTNRADRESTHARTRYHLVLLAQNLAGYHNLVRLVTLGHLEGFHYKPRVDKELLAKYGDGLIALSGCLQGEVVQKLINEGFDAGAKAAREYEEMFPGRFYLEVQANGLEEQERANDMLIELSKTMSLPLAATNDCHYLSKDDAEAHDILLCIQTNARVDDEKRMRFRTRELYYRSPEEMSAAFSHCPDAVSNTVRIAERCNVELPLGELFFPAYTAPNGKSLEEELRDLSRKGLERRLSGLPYPVDEKEYRDRLEYELDVIVKMGFAGYFLIVQDFINWAKDKGIPVGPGRGSAAGSLVSYALRITNLDPLPYNLLFERFLNIARVSMPDIDVDFCERRRGEVIRYVTEKYGQDCVAQITTFGTMKARAVVRDVGRVLGLSFAETDKIAKLIPETLKITIDKALESEPELREMVKNDERTARLIDISRRLEGLHRHASTHAAGVVLSDRPMIEYLPLYKGKKDEVVTQYDMKMVEKTGLIKFDFLGLRTMTVIQDTLDIIAERGKEPPDMDVLSLDDAETYALYSRGDTDGVFQVESSGMRRYLRMLKPTCFDDLIAMLALYRPGPLGSGRGHGDNMVDEFIKRKHGEVKVTYPVPALEEVLKPTYGVIVYQEQ
ncbi:MAG: DNA polymerase III subunit alpha, partial [Thermodesulfobacteriota bacterium]|nr:DNA polymerase III subunit alpha [Thermodesulfobacteriota bacterium]